MKRSEEYGKSNGEEALECFATVSVQLTEFRRVAEDLAAFVASFHVGGVEILLLGWCFVRFGPGGVLALGASPPSCKLSGLLEGILRAKLWDEWQKKDTNGSSV